MKVFEDENQLGSVESSFVWFKHSLFSEMGEEFPSCDILHEEVNVFGVLIHSFEVDDERMRDGFEDLVLVTDVIDLLSFNEFNFFHDFGTVILSVIFAFYQFYSAK